MKKSFDAIVIGAGQAGPPGEVGEGQRLHTALGEQRAGGLKQRVPLQLTMLGQGGGSDLGHPTSLDRSFGGEAVAVDRLGVSRSAG